MTILVSFNLQSAHFSSRPRCIDVRKIRKERTDVGKLRKNRADVEKVRKNRADVERIRRRNVEGIRKRKAAAETIRKKRAEQVIEEVARSSDSNNQEIIKILTSDLQSSVTEKDQSTKVYMGLVATKSVFGVSDKVRFKPVSLATETS